MQRLENTLDYSSKIILEVESNGKYFSLVSSPYKPDEDMLGNPVYKWNLNKSNKIRRIFYVMWGNEPELMDRGVSCLLTKKGNPMTQAGAMRELHRMIKATKIVNFKL